MDGSCHAVVQRQIGLHQYTTKIDTRRALDDLVPESDFMHVWSSIQLS
jgi:hypothetical protein